MTDILIHLSSEAMRADQARATRDLPPGPAFELSQAKEAECDGDHVLLEESGEDSDLTAELASWEDEGGSSPQLVLNSRQTQH